MISSRRSSKFYISVWPKTPTEGWLSTEVVEGLFNLRNFLLDQPEDPEYYGRDEVLGWRTCKYKKEIKVIRTVL